MKILVTGGCGFVGAAVVNRLYREGHNLTIVDNLFTGRPKRVEGVGELINVDLRDASELRRVIGHKTFDEVYHIAALHFVPYCNRFPAETVDVNVVGTQNVLDQIYAGRYFVTSTAAVYGNVDVTHAEGEDSWPIDVYGLSKRASELMAEGYAKRWKSTAVVAGRLFNAYGNGDTSPHLIPAILKQVHAGQRVIKLGNVEPKRDYIWVDDAADGIIAAARGCKSGFNLVNIATGVQWDARQVVDAVAKASGYDLQVESGTPGLTRRQDRMTLLADVTKIKSETGWEAKTKFYDGINALWEIGPEALAYLREDVLCEVAS